MSKDSPSEGWASTTGWSGCAVASRAGYTLFLATLSQQSLLCHTFSPWRSYCAVRRESLAVGSGPNSPSRSTRRRAHRSTPTSNRTRPHTLGGWHQRHLYRRRNHLTMTVPRRHHHDSRLVLQNGLPCSAAADDLGVNLLQHTVRAATRKERVDGRLVAGGRQLLLQRLRGSAHVEEAHERARERDAIHAQRRGQRFAAAPVQLLRRCAGSRLGAPPR